MDVRDGFIGTIGNTPLIRLHRASELTGCEILGKAEFLNPGSSVKDRAALFIIKDAEERGALKPGGAATQVNPLEKLLPGILGGAKPQSPQKPQSGQSPQQLKPEDLLKDLLKGLGGG